MSTAAFSIPSDSHRQISVRRRSQSPSTPTSAAADEAIRQLVERRRRRHQYGEEHDPKPSLLDEALGTVTAPVRESIHRLGVGRFMFAAVVLGVAGIALTVAVVTLSTNRAPCPLYPLSGRLVIGKVIPAGAQVSLLPKSAPLPDDAVPRAIVREDGSFIFGTFAKEDGVPAGEYVVLVQWFRVSSDGSGGANVLPANYASPATSPLSVTVTEGTNPPLQFVIKK
jgi:hypothetical protein